MESLTEMYCMMDDFYKVFGPEWEKHLLNNGDKKRRRKASLSIPEVMCLVVLFHQLRFRQFKSFYTSYAQRFLKEYFPGLPSYQRFVELMPRSAVPLTALFQIVKGKCTGISIADSTPIAVCDNLRIRRHRVFADIAARGKSSTGWFFGFKLHAVINHSGDLLAIKLTPGNVDDRKPLPELCDGFFGKLLADKGYLATWLTNCLHDQGIELITKLRKNMKKITRHPFDEALLRKRSVIETVFDELKNLCQIEHTRHRSIANFLVNLIAGVIAYCLSPVKPRMSVLSNAPIAR